MSSRYHTFMSDDVAYALPVMAFLLVNPNPEKDCVSCMVGEHMEHPVTHKKAWRFTDDPIRIHPNVTGHELDPILHALEGAGFITENDSEVIRNRIISFRGTAHTAEEVAGPLILSDVRTKSQMEADGWFEQPEGIQQ